jgi:hypothetical protein
MSYLPGVVMVVRLAEATWRWLAYRCAAPCVRLAAATSLFLATVATGPASAQSITGCQFLTGGGPAAFCDTFDAPSVNPGRAGALAPVWGASRVTGNANLGSGYDNVWGDTQIVMCDGSTPTVHSPNDIQICNGQLREAINDTGMNDLALYPRQPFDIAGRTGTVSFDVSDDSAGGHSAWPELSYTDQPIPAPGPDQVPFPNVLVPRNSVNVAFGAAWLPPNGPPFAGRIAPCVSIDDVWITSNYGMSMVPATQDDCIEEPAQNSFVLNHVEVKFSATGLVVYGSDAGSRAMRQIGHANYTSPLTRGLLWIKDVHYNAHKAFTELGDPYDQEMHTFAWDNFAFDGPVLPRDLGVQLPDKSVTTNFQQPYNGLPDRELGIALNAGVGPGLKTRLDFSGSNALSGVENASAALLEMNYLALDEVTFNYSVNGHTTHTQPWATSSALTWNQETIAFPVPTSELVDGANDIDFWVTNAPSNVFGLSNIDLILVGAGGGGTPGPMLVPSPTATPPTATAARLTATAVPPTPMPSPTPPASGPWTFCAGDNSPCTFSGTMWVRYGNPSTNQWVYGQFTNGVYCNSEHFGSDPAPGGGKECDTAPLAATAAPSPTPTSAPPSPSPTTTMVASPTPTRTPRAHGHAATATATLTRPRTR